MGGHPLAQRLGLADVDHPAPRVAEQVHAGGVGKRPALVGEALCGRGRHGSSRIRGAAPARAQFGVGGASDRATGETYHVELGGYLWSPTPDIVITKVRRLVGSDRLRGPGEGHPAGFALQALGIVPADRSLVERAAERFAALGFDGEAAATLASGPEGWCPGEASPIIAVGP